MNPYDISISSESEVHQKLMNPYTWRKNWIRPYESSWSILEKFKFANTLTAREVLKILGTDRVKSLKAGIGSCHRNLITLSGFDSHTVQDVLGFDMVSFHQKIINQLLSPLLERHRTTFFLREDLAICEACLKTGYHSIFHQWRFLHYCPFHLSPLHFACPNCSQIYTYEMTDDGFLSPYVCKCGHFYLQESAARFFYKEWGTDDAIRCNKVKTWLSEVNYNSKKMESIYLFTEKGLHQSPTLFDGVLSFLTNENSKTPKRYISQITTPKISMIKGDQEKYENMTYSKKSYPHIGEYSLGKSRLRVQQEDLFLSYNQLISSIARNLRKTVLMKHKTCIERYFLGDNAAPKCPYAFAYVHWRSFVQGFQSPRHVTARYKRPKTVDHRFVQFPFTLYSEFFEDVVDLWKSQVEDISNESRASLKWVLGRSIAHVSISLFWTWLSIAKKLMTKFIMLQLPPFSYEYLSPFFLVLPFGEQKVYEIHSEAIPDKINIISEQICPFQTVKSRRDPKRREKIQHAKQQLRYYKISKPNYSNSLKRD
ncbi:hypothetical protein [Brevibacillus brevis]|uniref:hypothetical protein n=1 Tax=Brevibacillus brevis TaxID=1393 RepID=UPI000D10D1B9|nr:hypothetical protein [Brevibacillus brevis]PSJ68211.1 hypothetical protein C7J99_17590 [Brevibacillus brevis]